MKPSSSEILLLRYCLDILVVCAKYEPVIIGNIAHLCNLKTKATQRRRPFPSSSSLTARYYPFPLKFSGLEGELRTVGSRDTGLNTGGTFRGLSSVCQRTRT
jgi:hypothetical protein